MTTDGIIVKGISGFYYVKANDMLYECKARGVFKQKNLRPFVGDKVQISLNTVGYDVIESILPRDNYFIRPPIANVDNMVVIVSTVEPMPNLCVIDKMLAIARISGVKPILVLSKADLADVSPIKCMYEKVGIRTFVSTLDATKIVDDLIDELGQAKISVFVGNSGVGKTTLLNKIIPGLDLKTSITSKKLGRGKHTTRQVELFEFNNGYLADTPGFSSLNIASSSECTLDNICDGFVEFDEYIGKCKFASCQHICEKGCAIIKAVDQQKISTERYESYIRMRDEIKEASR